MNDKKTKEFNIGLVIMASGAGKRFGSNKLMEPLNGKPLIQWIIDSTENLFDKRIVVTRHKEVKELCDRLGIDCIMHYCPNRNDTVRIGLSALAEDVEYCFFAPSDQPFISRDSLIRLTLEAKRCNDKIVRTSYNDTNGSPMGFPKSFFDELLSLPEGKGGNYIAKKNEDLVNTVRVRYEYELWDIDTREDLNRAVQINTQGMDMP